MKNTATTEQLIKTLEILQKQVGPAAGQEKKNLQRSIDGIARTINQRGRVLNFIMLQTLTEERQ